MASHAHITVLGNIGRDPEMRYTPTGTAVTEFSVAVSNGTRNPQTGEWTNESDWYRVTVWGSRAEKVAESFTKGNNVFVQGRFKTRNYTTRDGRAGTSLEITADTVLHLDPRQKAEGDEGQYTQQAAQAPARVPVTSAAAGDDLDDLPF
jgi:single-strand DNA-binding protein